MGACQSAHIQPTDLQVKELVIGRCFVVEQPPEVIVQVQGTIHKIPIHLYKEQLPPDNIQLSHQIGDNMYMSGNNQLICVFEFQHPDDNTFKQAMYHYWVVSRMKAEGLVQMERPIVVLREKGTCLLLLCGKLERQGKVVSLKNLGQMMRQKGICWGDSQFLAVVREVFKVMGRVHVAGYWGLTDVLVSTQGEVYCLAALQPVHAEQRTFSLKKDEVKIRALLLSSLYGHQLPNQERIQQQQAIATYKHTQTLKHLNNLHYYLQLYASEQRKPLPYSSKKYIKDYIDAYLYQLQNNRTHLYQAYERLGEYEEARQLLVQYIMLNNQHQAASKAGLKNYEKLVELERKLGKEGAQQKAAQIAYELSMKEYEGNNYRTAYQYLKRAYCSGAKGRSQLLYFRLFELSYGLGLYEETQQYLDDATAQYRGSNWLCITNLVYKADCLRIEEGEKLLHRHTSVLSSLSFSVASARLELFKSMNRVGALEAESLRRGEEELKRVVLVEDDAWESSWQTVLMYETLGDILFKKRQYTQAQQKYEKCLMILKTSQPWRFKQSQILSSLGNCHLLLKKYSSAKKFYNQSLEYISNQCQIMLESIICNIAIAEYHQNQNRMCLETVKEFSTHHPKNINYKFMSYVSKNGFEV